MKKYEMLPTEENIIETLYNDPINRNKDIVYFYNILQAQESASAIAIDGRWGSGKTFFVRQTQMVINALKKAFKTAKPVILNSDQGCQFTSNEYMNFLKENQIRQSMDGKSRWADNIMIERWFRSFKYEEAYLTQYANIREARKAIGKYIHTYNFERCHSAINNQTPASYYYPVLLIEYAA